LIAPKERRYSKKGKMIAPLQQAFTNTLNSLNLMHKRDLKHGARFAPDSIRIVEYDEEHADLGAIYNLDSKTIAISYKHSEITEHDFLVYCAEMNPDFLGVCIGKKWMKRYNSPIMVEY
jgi:hypothetical protein